MKRWGIYGCLIVALMLWGLAAGAAAAAQATVIKVALITPEGSAWTDSLHKLAAAVAERTKGAVTFTVYAGGIAGDELDVLRKMQADRIHAAGFSGVGLGILVPPVRLLEAPLLFKTEAEIDFVKNELADRFAAEFEQKGFILLGFAEAGFVYFFSSASMSGPQGFDPLKMWVWKGDPVAKTSLEALGIKTYPLQLTDVTTGLETGMINAFYSPPAAAIAYQWHAKVGYMLDYPMVNSTGAFLIKKSVFDRLSKENRIILREASAGFCDELVHISRRVNAEAREVLLNAGIVFEKPTEDQLRRFETKARQIHADNIDRLYSRDLFDTVTTLLEERRR
ncbi:MAG: TRAP transporter substrate-binding protein DctP [Deltaproteobacteria bacterium]|nr:TRAP transporter substrate-binding protein DctP [Deltaproteobacteria bacterium]